MKNLIQVKPLKCPWGHFAISVCFTGRFAVLFGIAFAYLLGY